MFLVRLLAAAESRVLGYRHHDTLGDHALHALALFELGQMREAEAKFADVSATQATVAGADDARTLMWRAFHGTVSMPWPCARWAGRKKPRQNSARWWPA
jgi:hypothetical protein